jgi:hypothetical protein
MSGQSGDDDPLEGADIGETRTVKREQTLHGINYTPNEYFGGDRNSDVELTDVEIIEAEDGIHDIKRFGHPDGSAGGETDA